MKYLACGGITMCILSWQRAVQKYSFARDDSNFTTCIPLSICAGAFIIIYVARSCTWLPPHAFLHRYMHYSSCYVQVSFTWRAVISTTNLRALWTIQHRATLLVFESRESLNKTPKETILDRNTITQNWSDIIRKIHKVHTYTYKIRC